MASKETKKARRKYWICKSLSIIFTILPIIAYVIIGFANGDIHKGKKVFLGCMLITAILLVIANIIKKYKLRSPIFIVFIGLYYVLDNLLPLFLLTAFGVIFDEFIFTPLTLKYKESFENNKTIDTRLGE